MERLWLQGRVRPIASLPTISKQLYEPNSWSTLVKDSPMIKNAKAGI